MQGFSSGLLSHCAGHFRRLGKKHCLWDVLFCGRPHPWHPLCGVAEQDLDPLHCPCSEGSHGLGTRRHLTLDRSQHKRLALYTQKHKIEVLSFKVNVFHEKAVHLGFPHAVLGSTMGLLACGSSIAHNCMHLLAL